MPRSGTSTPKSPARIDIVSYLTPPASRPNLKLQRLPAEHEPLLRDLQAHFDQKGLELPVRESTGYEDDEENIERRGLDERELMYLSRENFVRYLLATHGNLQAAITRLEQTIVWRRTEGIEDVETLAQKYKYQNRKGKGIVLGYTPDCQPIVYSFINRNPTPVNERRGVDTTFMIERATDLMVDGVSECLVIFQYGGEKLGESSTLNSSRDMLNIISSHYPHKFSLAAFQGMPWLVRTATNVVWPFVDAGLRDRVKYDKELVKDGDVEKEVLLKQCGGALDYMYDHEQYWDTMIRVCLERRRDALERWRSLGEKQSGREERLFKVRPTVGA